MLTGPPEKGWTRWKNISGWILQLDATILGSKPTVVNFAFSSSDS